MIQDSSLLLTAFSLGLLGSGHCFGMCGGISAALGANAGGKFSNIILFNLTRALCYAILGLVFGSGLQWLGSEWRFLMPILRLISGLLLIAMGLYVASWWMGLTALERAGSGLWKKVQPLTTRLLPADTTSKASLLGLLWGLIPCGLVYSSLTWSVTATQSAHAGVLMFFFGLGTLPLMITTSIAGNTVTKLLAGESLRRIMGVMLILFGIWTAVMPIMSMMKAGHH